MLPPLVGIVMSRAKHRKQIPEVIRDMRTEYGEARDKLWDLFKNAWGTYEQLRYVRIDLFPNLLAKLTAATLYHDFCASRNLFDSRHILGQHLTDAEQRAFGLRQ